MQIFDKLTDSTKNTLSDLKKLRVSSYLQDLNNNTIDLETKVIGNLQSLINSSRIYSKSSLLMINESADYDLYNWIAKFATTQKLDSLMSMFAQLIFGIASLHSLYIVHADLHAANILVSKTNTMENNVYLYSVGGKNYYIPYFGFLFKLWDFGRSIIVNNKLVGGKDILYDDIYHITYTMYDGSVKHANTIIDNIKKWNLNRTELLNLLSMFDYYKIFNIIDYLFTEKFKPTNKLPKIYSYIHINSKRIIDYYTSHHKKYKSHIPDCPFYIKVFNIYFSTYTIKPTDPNLIINSSPFYIKMKKKL